jgi:hypothetical protein
MKRLILLTAALCSYGQYVAILTTDVAVDSLPQLNKKLASRAAAGAPGAGCTAGLDLYINSTNSAISWCPAGSWVSTLPNVNTTATSANTASAIVARDASGNFSAGTISAALNGNSSTATQLAANPTNCSAGNYPLGIDASGNVESCTSAGGAGTFIKSFGNISNPSTAESGDPQLTIPFAATITRVWCNITDGTSVTINLEERGETTPNTAGTAVLTSNLVCDTNTEITTSFANASIAQRAPVALMMTAVSGTPRALRVHVEYTIP